MLLSIIQNHSGHWPGFNTIHLWRKYDSIHSNEALAKFPLNCLLLYNTYTRYHRKLIWILSFLSEPSAINLQGDTVHRLIVQKATELERVTA